MARSLSQEAKTILSLLNNCEELVTISNDRKRAADQIKALAIFARNKKFPMNETKIQNYLKVIIDSRAETLKYILMDIANDVVSVDKSRK